VEVFLVFDKLLTAVIVIGLVATVVLTVAGVMNPLEDVYVVLDWIAGAFKWIGTGLS
jgi:ethanolamine transporter EutH